MQIPGGMLADRFKPRIVIACATLGWGFFQAIAAGCAGWVALLLTRLGLGPRRRRSIRQAASSTRSG